MDSPGEGQGSTFTVQLPLAVTTTVPPSSTQLPTATDAALTGLQILFVEDDADNRNLITFILQQQGAAVTAMDSGFKALALLQQKTPDLLISDIGMPDIDGYAFLKAVRALNSDAQKVPAIALTAYAGDLDQQRAQSAGFQEHLSKPIDPKLLIATVLTLVGKSSVKQSSSLKSPYP